MPVTFTMEDFASRFELYVTATKKLNPQCAENCELGQAIEDGGCTEIRLSPTYTCTPGGGLFMPFRGAAPDGGTVTATRGIAPGSELKLYDTENGCTQTVTINGATTLAVVRTTGGCTITSR